MEDKTFKSFKSRRLTSLSTMSDFSSSGLEFDVDDPISAYFKKRCETSSKSFLKKPVESESDSSVGLIDLDNVSVFEEDDEKENENSLRNSFPTFEKSKSERHSSVSICNSFCENSVDPEVHLRKQRALAQKALMKFDKVDESQSENSLAQSNKAIEISKFTDHSNVLSENLQSNKQLDKPWFQPNFSPNTPRYFNDELSSFGGGIGTLQKYEVAHYLLTKEFESEKKNEQEKKMNSVLGEFDKLDLSGNMEFKSQSQEEKICRLEDDEKLFQFENSGLLHNSCISQFSGNLENNAQCSSTTDLTSNPENKKLSIGQFFNMRSNRISSLIGLQEGKDDIAMSSPRNREVPSFSLLHEQSLPVSNVSKNEKLKPRRCVSTYDLKPGSELSRFSSDSTTSNSTVMIQNILAEMESGLSGTQIYEKLLKAYGTKKVQKNEGKSVLDEKLELLKSDYETPKSSKVAKKKDSLKKNEFGSKELRNFRQNLEINNLTDSPKCNLKQNRPAINDLNDLNSDQSLSILRNEKIKQMKGKKGFDASTPKVQHFKTQNEKRESSGNDVFLEKDDWEVPRVSSIHPSIIHNRTGSSDDIDKTLTCNSSSTIFDIKRKKNINKNATVMNQDTHTVEDTIIAGDLTILSQKIEEMKEEGVCIVRSANADEPVLLEVVQELADLPQGSVDCSSLTPLIRDQFPELLSNFPTPSSDRCHLSKNLLISSHDKTKNLLVSEPGCWVKLPMRMGFNEKLSAFKEVKRVILVPISNTSKNWLLASIESVVINHPSGGRLQGAKINDEWNICDFITISMKDSVIPPNSQQMLQVFYLTKVASKLDWKINFLLKKLLCQDVQSRSVLFRIQNVDPLNSINVIPKDSINFGVIADQCFDLRTFQLTFDGVCEMPLVVYLDQKDFQSPHFLLRFLNSGSRDSRGEWRDEKFYITLKEGEKQLLEFQVIFQPNILISDTNKIQDFKAALVVKIDHKNISSGILQEISIKGSVGFAKFFWNSSRSPLVFRVHDRSQMLTRSFPLKNVGNLPIAFSVKIEDENKEKSDFFTAAKTFYLSRNEESAINVTFNPTNATSKENCVKSIMSLQIKPNGRAKYDVELIGIISSTESRPISRLSNISASTNSLSNTESTPVKILTTTNYLSWVSVPLEKELKQTFQLKNASNIIVTARITFKNHLGSFKLVNENGEKVPKIRKVLKPDFPFNLAVAFRPDSVGPHHNALFIETNQLSGKKMILLNGIGGTPNLFLGNVKSDLNGCKMIVLQNAQSCNQIYSNHLEFKNGGRIPGFILIKSNTEALSLSHDMVITPSSCVILPDSKIVVKLSQKLKNDDLRQLLSGKDISKVATLSVIMGDEPSRMRFRKLIESGKLLPSERSKVLTAAFDGEKEMNLSSFEDSLSFENQFLKSLKVVEVAVVVERSLGVCEPTILVDEDETIDEFVTICSAMDSTIKSSMVAKNGPEELSNKLNNNSHNTVFSAELNSSHNKITKWLETLEYPGKKS